MANKTAVIYYAGFQRWGGVLSHVRELEGELRRTGWRVTVITLDSLPIWCRYAPHAVRLLWDLIDRPLGLFYKDSLTGALYKRFFDLDADLRVFEDVYIGWNSGVASITMLHAVWSDNLQAHPVSAAKQEKLKRREINVIESTRHPIATVSHPYRRFIQEEHFSGRLTKPLEVVELGIVQERFTNAVAGNKKSIVYVGALEPRKNVLFLLEIYEKLVAADPDYRLTIVGDGPQRNMLFDYAKGHGLVVSFLGSLSHDGVATELSRHGVYLHTSIKESFSYSLLEAKLTGLKTCASAKLQVPSDFIDAAVESFDADDWCRAILDIDGASSEFDARKYSVGTMTRRIVELAE